MWPKIWRLKKRMTTLLQNNFHGWVVLFKPEGPTSFDIIRQLRKIIPKVKCGHAGTLDPLASGVLPLALGEATKVISWLTDSRKIYRFEVTWGEQRTTDDREGAIMATSTVRPTRDQIEAILSRFVGDILQMPPLYSAIKVSGKRACDRMRSAEEVTLQPRPIHVGHLKLLQCLDNNRATFEVECGKGTYVRSLARDMAQTLGTLGYASAIHRAKVGPFTEDCAIPIETLAIGVKKGVLQEYIQPLDTVLDDIPAVRVDSFMAQALRQGQAVSLDKAVSIRGLPKENQPLFVYAEEGLPLAMTQFQQGQLWPKRVFNISQ
jgi:tRNA pseudouridine55 synthase